jgi:hypothetical protein
MRRHRDLFNHLIARTPLTSRSSTLFVTCFVRRINKDKEIA